MSVMYKPFQNLYQNVNNQPNWSLLVGQRIWDAFNTVQDYISQLSAAVNSIAPSSGGSTGPIVGTGVVVYVEINITAPTTITPTAPTLGTLLIYKLKQDATGHAVTWGSIAGTAFIGAPIVPVLASTNNIVSFIGASDGNWYAQAPIMVL